MTGDDRKVREIKQNEEIRALKHELALGRISRRDFLSRAAALGVGGALAGALIGTAGDLRAETPKRGGRLRAAMTSHSPSDTLDPAKFTASIDFCRGYQFYNPLVRISAKLTPEPELAESWEAKPGATEWVFKLRRGIDFNNGKALEAGDVVYSLGRHKDESIGSTASKLLEAVTDIRADDKHTVHFTLDAPNADFPMVLGDFHMMIVPEGHTDFTKAIGTGPFLLEEFTPGVRSVAVRNPNYWKEGRPYIDELEWFGITDSVARLNALLSGDIQMMADLDPKAIPQVESTEGVSVLNVKAGAFIDIVAMCDREPTSNPDLRMALKHLQNRERIVKGIYKGYAQVANDQPISPIDPFYCAEIPQRPLDHDKAKFHLKKAGMENTTITLHTSEATGPGSIEQALLMQQEAGQIGLNIEVKRDPADGYWSQTWMNFPFHMGGWNMRPTADLILTQAFKSDAPWNEAQWKNEHFDKLLVEARAELDQARRKEIYCEMQRMIHETGGHLIPCFLDIVDATSDKVKGHDPVPLGPLGGSQFPDKVWIDA